MRESGATLEEWKAFHELAPADVRPYVADRTFDPSGRYGKTPSVVYARVNPKTGLRAGGMFGWTTLEPTKDDLSVWQADDRLGLGIVCRTVHAIDIDIDDPELAEDIDDFFCSRFPGDLPMRRRGDSPRRVLLWRTAPKADVPKSVVIVATPKLARPYGKVEVLGTRQFVALCGEHQDGARQGFPLGLPTLLDVPAMTIDEFNEVLEEFTTLFGEELQTETAANIPEVRTPGQVNVDEPITKHVLRHECYERMLPSGAIAVTCPWQDQHTKQDEPGHSATVFFPQGLGGRSSPGFKCMHSTHGPKSVGEFLQAIDYDMSEEFDIEPEQPSDPEPMPEMMGRKKNGEIPCNMVNLRRILHWEGFPYSLKLDTFSYRVLVKVKKGKWRPLEDTDVSKIEVALNMLYMPVISTPRLRQAIHLVAQDNSFDSMVEWLNALKWDGQDRISGFASNVLRVDETPYTQAVSHYLWSALAGRVLKPGIKADMVPILCGAQGARKSSFAKRLSPDPEFFLEHDLSTNEADGARMTRGKLVVELADLKGFNSRDENAIKAWVTRNYEEWVPKYQEQTTRYLRRFVAIGTSNPRRILSDSTGNRRWLPIAVDRKLDTDYLVEHREQLWAQGAALFKKHGIMFHKAEQLASQEHPAFTRLSAPALALMEHLQEHPQAEYTTPEVLRGLYNMELTHRTAQQHINLLEHAFQALGYEDDGMGKWSLPFL